MENLTNEIGERTSLKDSIQSDQYKFPYHYIPMDGERLSLALTWKFSASYIAALRLAEAWLTNLKIHPNHLHIDYGCGDGAFLFRLKRKFQNQITFKGVDYDAKAIAWANMFSSGEIEFANQDISDIPDASVYSGTLVEVLEHIPPSDVANFISEITRTLKTRGQLFVTVPSNEKKLTDKHYQHFDFEKIKRIFSQEYDILALDGFEKRTVVQKILEKLSHNRIWYFESKLTNSLRVKFFEKKYKNLEKCGRICVVLEKKK